MSGEGRKLADRRQRLHNDAHGIGLADDAEADRSRCQICDRGSEKRIERRAGILAVRACREGDSDRIGDRAADGRIELIERIVAP